YYPDGLRSRAGYADAGVSSPSALQYTYRTDGKRDQLMLSNGAAFTWAYTSAGRLLSQSDPLTGTTVSPTASYQTGKVAKPFYPGSLTYAPWKAAYGGYGRVNNVTLPVSLFSYTGSQYDLEDGIAQVTDSGYSPTTAGFATTAMTCLESSIRNEKSPLAKGYLTSSPCTMSPNPPGEINGAQVVPGDGSSSGALSARIGTSGQGQNWTLDARSGMLLHITKPLGSDTVGASYTYDASGRLTQDVEAVGILVPNGASSSGQMSSWCPVIYAGTTAYPNGFSCYENGTRTKTYDAENRLRTETLTYTPGYSANGPTYTATSYGFALYGSYWADSSAYGQPVNLQAVDYGASSHPMRFALYHPDRAGNPNTVASESRVWLWDGNDRFLECASVNNACQSPSLSVEGLADFDLVHGTVTRVNDRNQSGQVVMSRNATSFSAWSDTRSWTNGKTFFSPCSIDVVDNSITPTICDPQRDGKLTPDGWSLDLETWQGVRTFDPAVGQWNSPDAYAGEVHDPMSQKPFMWNRDNPYTYNDPSGLKWDKTLSASPQQRMIDYMRANSLTFKVIYNTLARSDRTYNVGFASEYNGQELGGFFLAPGSIELHPFGKFGNGADSDLAGMIDRFAHEIGHAFDYETNGGHFHTDWPAPSDNNPHKANNYAEWFASQIHDMIMEELERNGYNSLRFAGQHGFADLPPYGVFPVSRK
ncbi:MAG: hypothetical protein M3N13_00320, partial [Candidatus Eremiobacteraeota bacterium]|nr:hypothetical protein [Candidatus Eremiobacteraeota bacterium]